MLHPLRHTSQPLKPIRFGGAELVAKELVAKIPGEAVAEGLYKVFSKVPEMGKVGGLSLEDWASRFLTIFGIYLPQGFIAFRENKHKWETNGRNALIWTMTVLLYMWSKSEKVGLNKLLNVFMKDRNQAAAAGQKGFFAKTLDKLKLDGDYFEILKNAGIHFKEGDRASAFWSALDTNQMDAIAIRYEELVAKKTLSDGEKKLVELIPKFVIRRNIFNLVSVGFITVLTMYLIGRLAMDIVFKFIAPMDHDFEPGRHPNAPKQTPPPASRTAQRANPVLLAPGDHMKVMGFDPHGSQFQRFQQQIHLR